LAFYQCIEYFFPQFSRQEAIAKVKNTLKDPAFDGNKDSCINRILNATLRTGSGKSDMDLGGGSVLPQPKMAEKRRTDEQTSTQEPFSGIQGEGGFGGDPGREDFGGVGRTV
jgi:hypothetical protein